MEEKTMKKTLFYLCALSCAALISCNKENQAPEAVEGGTIKVVVDATSEEGGAKAYMAELSDSKYPVYWNDVEYASIDEFTGTTKSQEIYSDSFVKDSQNPAKGKFTFTMAAKEGDSFDYYVITPGKSSTPGAENPTHGWRACKTGNISYIVNHTVDQVPLADRPDPTTHVMLATSKGHTAQQTSFNLEFKHIVSYGKMTITNFPALAQGETVSKITITVPAGQYITGRYYENINTGEKVVYKNNSGVPQAANYITINPQNITFNTTGFDVWFTCHTLELAKDDMLSVKVETSAKTYEGNLKISKALSFKAGVVSAFTYNWTKSQPQAETKTLTFGFSTCPEGWPSGVDEYKSKDHSTKTLPYVLYGVTYNFITAVCLDLASSSTRSIAWGYDGTNAQSYFVSQPERFFGLPAIEGWKLITVKFTQACSDNNSRKVCITSAVTNQTKQSTAYVTGGEPQSVTKQGQEYTYNLTGTQANTVYYWAPTAKGNGFATLTLVYEKVEK